MELEFALNPEQSDLDCIRNGIYTYNRQHLPQGAVTPVGCFARDTHGNIVAGLTGQMFSNTVFVEYLWVSEAQRGTRLGSRLIHLLEEQVKAHDVTHLYLDTYSFQALDFYLKLGFSKVGEYTGFPSEGIVKYFLQKQL
ncbi:GNAT family N-acetyltransferase [Vibrio sp. CAU 1672]|uniref:GNAT family N-acetyltransferase n=1 Tax=Vibrio sp. CAU 1672 TaxID=3032594 RepID=UPI0023D9AE5C|nr:GNAT family N-acetyltransferase [Vibrio sp. CAU 1672]MDF2152722.1 GNAT family N-acetyltransferase [Vibrio sp. CAU 1672]